MDFRYTPHEQQFRLEVRRFIAEHCPCELKGFHEIHAEHVPLEMAFLKKMAARAGSAPPSRRSTAAWAASGRRWPSTS